MAFRLSRLRKVHQALSIFSVAPHSQNPNPNPNPFNPLPISLTHSKTLETLLFSSSNPRIASPPHRRILDGFVSNILIASISSSSRSAKEEVDKERSGDSKDFSSSSWIDLHAPSILSLSTFHHRTSSPISPPLLSASSLVMMFPKCIHALMNQTRRWAFPENKFDQAPRVKKNEAVDPAPNAATAIPPHIAQNQVKEGQDCFICKRRGHIAKNCPEKNKHISQDCVICLRCGDLGHEMLSCKNDYAPEDLKEIQCYVCKNFGHLCCVDFVDNSPREVSCYNCSQTGHTGLGCAKRRGEMTDVSTSSTVCFKCGEEGHFARGCTNNLKFDRWESGSSTPWRPTDENRESLGFRSVPNEFGKPRKNKKKTFYYEDDFEDRWNTSSSKSKIKGGWIVDDPDEISRRSHEKANRWKSHTSPTTKSHKSYSKTSSGYYSTPQSPFSKQKSFMGTPNSHAASRHHSRHSNGYSTPRHYGRSQGYYDRT